MTAGGSTHNTITIPSSSDQIPVVDDFLEDWLRKRNVPEDVIADLAIAVTELVNNAIKHGNKGERDKKVTLTLRLGDGRIEVTVTDEGKGFDPHHLPDPLADENLLKEIGRGIFIAKSLMDECQFSFPPGGGTKVYVMKRIA